MLSLAFVAALLGTQDELEPIESELATAIAEIVSAEAAKIEKPRIKVDPDAAKAAGLHVPERYGLMVVPQKGLAEEGEGYRAANGKPLGYLFLYRLRPVAGESAVAADALHAIAIEGSDGESRSVHVLLLSVRRVADDDWRLYGFGSAEKPVLDVKFSPGEGSGKVPVDLQSGEKGRIALTVFNKYRASFGFKVDAE